MKKLLLSNSRIYFLNIYLLWRDKESGGGERERRREREVEGAERQGEDLR